MNTLRRSAIQLVTELRRRRRDPWAFISWLLVPLMVGSLITLLTTTSSAPQPVASLLVTDLDGSLISGALVAMLGDDRMAELVRAEAVDEAAGRQRIDDGDASGWLVIPAGFGQAVLADQPTTLVLRTNPAQTILPKILEELLSVLTDAGFYAHRAFGDELRQISQAMAGEDSLSTSAKVAALAATVKTKADRLGPMLSPPALDLDVVKVRNTPKPATPRPSFAQLLLPGLLMMALVFTTQALSAELWVDREQGTLRRLVSTAHGVEGVLLGKTVAAAITATAVALVLLAIGGIYHDLTWWRQLRVVPWLLASAAFFYLLLTALQLVSSSRHGGMLTSQLLVLPLLMTGGSFFPVEVLPGLLGTVGRLTPNGLLTEVMKSELLATELFGAAQPERHVALAALATLLASAMLFAFCRARFKSFAAVA